MNVTPSSSFEAVVAGFESSVTVGVRILDNAGGTHTVRTTSGISEFPVGSGIYYKSLTAPSTPGQYTIMWDNGNATPGNIAVEDLVVE